MSDSDEETATNDIRTTRVRRQPRSFFGQTNIRKFSVRWSDDRETLCIVISYYENTSVVNIMDWLMFFWGRKVISLFFMWMRTNFVWYNCTLFIWHNCHRMSADALGKWLLYTCTDLLWLEFFGIYMQKNYKIPGSSIWECKLCMY